jgi:hypothetical protein
MKIHFDDMTKTEQWIITSISPDLITEILELNSSEGLDIFFTINGVEIPFNKVVERIEEAFDSNLGHKVVEISGIRNEFLGDLENLRKGARNLSTRIEKIARYLERQVFEDEE